jgi:ADP-ribose pyrophosphatase YjhB (NUDIX family)
VTNETDTCRVVAYVFMLRADTVLLLKRAHTGFQDGKYGPPGGHLEAHESVVQAAVRECREEIGVEILPQDLQVVGVCHYDTPEGRGVDFFLTTTEWTGGPYARSECDSIVWCSPDDLPEGTIPFIRRAIERHLLAGVWYDEIGW